MVSIAATEELRLLGVELPLRLRAPSLLDDDHLLRFCAANRELRVERAADGEIWVMAPTGGDTSWRNSEINRQLANWAVQDGRGRAFDSSGGFRLDDGAMRSPDAAWVDRSRWDALDPSDQRRFPPLCPDFVIELLSPSDAGTDAHAKMREYLDNGCRLGWLIDPDARVVWAYHHGGAVERHEAPATVAGDPVLPGFVLDLTTIW